MHVQAQIRNRKLSAGILPYTMINNDIYILLGRDINNHNWSDFGGKCEIKDTKSKSKTINILLKCATREAAEESINSLGTQQEIQNHIQKDKFTNTITVHSKNHNPKNNPEIIHPAFFTNHSEYIMFITYYNNPAQIINNFNQTYQQVTNYPPGQLSPLTDSAYKILQTNDYDKYQIEWVPLIQIYNIIKQEPQKPYTKSHRLTYNNMTFRTPFANTLRKMYLSKVFLA